MNKTKYVMLPLIAVILFSCKNVYANDSLLEAYNYDSNTCKLGTESTCVKNTCYEKRGRSCADGTIIKYQVNSTTVKYFSVIDDTGTKLILQSIDDIVSNTAWYEDDTLIPKNTNGPLTVLPKLEEATKDWTNVDDQTIEWGVTLVGGYPWTGCASPTACDKNQYTLPARTSKARMITVVEAFAVGCTADAGSCPSWMSTNMASYTGYWTMNAVTNAPQNNYAWYVSNGYLHTKTNEQDNTAARAVVVVDKSIKEESSSNDSSNSNNNSSNTNNGISTTTNNNNGETVAVDNTSASILATYLVGFIILMFGGLVLYSSIRKPNMNNSIKK